MACASGLKISFSCLNVLRSSMFAWLNASWNVSSVLAPVQSSWIRADISMQLERKSSSSTWLLNLAWAFFLRSFFALVLELYEPWSKSRSDWLTFSRAKWSPASYQCPLSDLTKPPLGLDARMVSTIDETMTLFSIFDFDVAYFGRWFWTISRNRWFPECFCADCPLAQMTSFGPGVKSAARGFILSFLEWAVILNYRWFFSYSGSDCEKKKLSSRMFGVGSLAVQQFIQTWSGNLLSHLLKKAISYIGDLFEKPRFSCYYVVVCLKVASSCKLKFVSDSRSNFKLLTTWYGSLR